MSEQEPVRIPKNVFEELESVRRDTRSEVLDIPTVWIDNHQQEYGQGLLDGFRARD